MVINIDVKNKIAIPDGSIIVCGNSDYQIKFTFDEEWAGLTYKTARFVYKKDGKLQYIDVAFSGDTVDVPILTGIRIVHVGVYTDALQTSSPAGIVCEYSIRCDSGENVEPYTPEDRDRLMAIFNEVVQEREAAKAAAEKAVEANAEAQEAAVLAQEVISGVVSKVMERNNGKYVTFWVGTQAEYKALTHTEANCLYITTDDMLRDPEYPNCCYKVVDGEKEWINPPMLLGVEYRTTEHHEGRPVYVKRISLNRTLSSDSDGYSSSTTVTDVPRKGTEILSATGYYFDPECGRLTLPVFNDQGKVSKWILPHYLWSTLMPEDHPYIEVWFYIDGEYNTEFTHVEIECTLKYIKTGGL